jgi:hypothetical protein
MVASSAFRQVCVATIWSRCANADGGPANAVLSVDVDGELTIVWCCGSDVSRARAPTQDGLTVPSRASSDAAETVRCRFCEVRKRIVSTDLIGLFLSANCTLLGGIRTVVGGGRTSFRAESPAPCLGVAAGKDGRRGRGAGCSSVSVSARREGDDCSERFTGSDRALSADSLRALRGVRAGRDEADVGAMGCVGDFGWPGAAAARAAAA